MKIRKWTKTIVFLVGMILYCGFWHLLLKDNLYMTRQTFIWANLIRVFFPIGLIWLMFSYINQCNERKICIAFQYVILLILLLMVVMYGLLIYNIVRNEIWDLFCGVPVYLSVLGSSFVGVIIATVMQIIEYFKLIGIVEEEEEVV